MAAPSQVPPFVGTTKKGWIGRGRKPALVSPKARSLYLVAPSSSKGRPPYLVTLSSPKGLSTHLVVLNVSKGRRPYLVALNLSKGLPIYLVTLSSPKGLPPYLVALDVSKCRPPYLVALRSPKDLPPGFVALSLSKGLGGGRPAHHPAPTLRSHDKGLTPSPQPAPRGSQP